MNAKELGRIGENSAALFLESEGWTILARNARVGRDEIDIVAECGDILCFAEVKTRRQYPDHADGGLSPADAVDAHKRESMIRAAEGWLALHPSEKSPRLDVIEVYVSPAGAVYEVLAIRRHENAVRKIAKFSPKRKDRH
ncbi:MAG: YraN family protein [Clostridia bacterium]|nr:YraN family protein [Clostridia bacterium]